MNNDRNLVRWHIEQTAGLDDLETFVHQGCRINGDSVAHLPCGVIQRLLYRDIGKLGFWRMQERPARRGKPDTANFFHAPARKTLVDSVVLAVDGQERL